MSKQERKEPAPSNLEQSQKLSGTALAKSGGPEPDVDDGTKAGKGVVPSVRPRD